MLPCKATFVGCVQTTGKAPHPGSRSLPQQSGSVALRRIIRTHRGVGGREVGGLHAHNQDLIRPIQGSMVPYPLPPTPLRVPVKGACRERSSSVLASLSQKSQRRASCVIIVIITRVMHKYTKPPVYERNDTHTVANLRVHGPM